MRTERTLPALFSGVALCLSFSLIASNPGLTPISGDTVKDKAVELLIRNLGYLKDLRSKGPEYVSTFKEGAKVHCDVCNEPQGPKPLEDYIYTITNIYKDSVSFTYEIHKERIELVKWDVEYHITVPFTKVMPLVKKGKLIAGKQQRVHLIAEIDYNSTPERIRISDIKLDKAPGSNMWMVEFSPLIAIGKPTSTALEALDPTWKGSQYQFGLVRYLYPGKGTNRQNVWLKVGLRAGLRKVSLTSDGVDFGRENVVLRSTRSQLSPAFAVQHDLALIRNVSSVREKVTSTMVEVPIGIGKRWAISRQVGFSLEFEAAIGMELTRKVNGDHVMDQKGQQTFTWGGILDPVTSEGSDYTYDMEPQALTGSDGHVYEFFEDETSILDDLKSKVKPYFSWGVNPSLFFRGMNDRVKYQLGLRLAMVGTHRSDGTASGAYFADRDNNERAALTTMVDGRFRPFVGLLFGIKL